jgi:hypothetical protein
VGGGGL